MNKLKKLAAISTLATAAFGAAANADAQINNPYAINLANDCRVNRDTAPTSWAGPMGYSRLNGEFAYACKWHASPRGPVLVRPYSYEEQGQFETEMANAFGAPPVYVAPPPVVVQPPVLVVPGRPVVPGPVIEFEFGGHDHHHDDHRHEAPHHR